MRQSKHDLEPKHEGFSYTPRVRSGRGRVPAVLLAVFVAFPALVCGIGSAVLGAAGLSDPKDKTGFAGLFVALGIGFLLLAVMMSLVARKRWRE